MDHTRMSNAPRPKLNLKPTARPIAGDATSKPARAPSREGLRAVTVYIDQDTWKQARKLVLDQETSLQAVLSEFLVRYVAEHAKS
jgi:hypothetical protein